MEKQFLLKAIGVRNYDGLTKNKEYKTLNGIEDGIFSDRPFVTIINDYGKEHSCHFQRFEIVKEIKEIDEIIESCRCNNCMTYFESDNDLIQLLDSDDDSDTEFYLGCPICKTDSYLMDFVKDDK